MAVQAVGRQVERAIGKPLDAEIVLVKAGFLHRVKGLIQSIRVPPRPEAFGSSTIAAIHA
jgi:hypothetical protein